MSGSPFEDNDTTPAPVARKAKPLAEAAAPASAAGPATASTRIPFGSRRAKLQAPPRPGFQRRWINDKGSRIQDAQAGGWNFVDKNGSPWSTGVGTSDSGGKLTAYLMEIPDEFYNADFAKKQEALDETDLAIYKGTHNQEPGDNRYVPRSTPIKIGVERGTGKG